MIELKNDSLVFSFPEVHPDASLTINFQRTFRIPDDDNDYPLPPGFGSFPMRHIDDYRDRVPHTWIMRGGVMLPMYQSEALWINFSPKLIQDRDAYYPFAIKVAAGKIDAVTGNSWTNNLTETPQDYVVAPEQPWLDGYCIKKGVIRQFVAMPLGSGYSAEEQITGKGEYGGLQLMVFPMKKEAFEKRFPINKRSRDPNAFSRFGHVVKESVASYDMGLAPGGKMRQEIYQDPFEFGDWELAQKSRCFVHIANSMMWREITGIRQPTPPLTAKEYEDSGLPWFDYYEENLPVLDGSESLNKLHSVMELANKKGDNPLPENHTVNPNKIVDLSPHKSRSIVREGVF